MRSRDASRALGHRRGVESARRASPTPITAKGKTYNSIVEELGVSYKTVVNTYLNLKRRLGAKNLSELIRAAVRLLPAEP